MASPLRGDNGKHSATLRNKASQRELRPSFNSRVTGGAIMGRYLLLWMLGIPLPILVLIYAFGGLH